MTLDEINTSENLKVLVFGEPGSGKTCFAAGFPTPIKFFDLDGKVNSAAQFYKNDTERLKVINVVRIDPNSDDGYTKLRDGMNELAKADNEGTLEYKTIVLDSLSVFSHIVEKRIVKRNPGLDRVIGKNKVKPMGLDGASQHLSRDDYGIIKHEFRRLLCNWLTINANIVMLGHIKVSQDDKTGEMYRSVNLAGSFGKHCPELFEEVYFSYVKQGKYFAQTQADYKYSCRTQRGLPKEIELKYERIIR